MVDPVSIATAAAIGGGSLLASKSMEKAAPALPAIPPGLQPTTQPNQKPKGPNQQQSFMSGAAVAQQAGGATSGGARGKSLIGA